MNSCRQPIFFRIFRSPSQCTESTALVRSMKIMYRSWMLMLLTALVLYLSGSKDHVRCTATDAKATYTDSPGETSWRWTLADSRLSKTQARMLPVIDSNEMPRWSSQLARSPFRLKICTIVAALKSWGTDSLSQIFRNSLVRHRTSCSPPSL